MKKASEFYLSNCLQKNVIIFLLSKKYLESGSPQTKKVRFKLTVSQFREKRGYKNCPKIILLNETGMNIFFMFL